MKKSRSLRVTLLRGVVIPSITVLFVLFGIGLIGTNLILSGIVDHQALLVAALARQGDQYLTETGSLMHSLAYVMPGLAPEGQVALLSQMRANYPRFTTLYLLDETGRVLVEDADTLALSGLDMSGRQFFQPARESGRVYFSDPFVSLTTRRVAVTCAVPIFLDDQFCGMFVGELDLGLLQQIIEQVDAGRDSLSFIVDQHGTMIAHSNPAWVQEWQKLGPLSLSALSWARNARKSGKAFNIFHDDGQNTWFFSSMQPMASNWIVMTMQPAVVAAQSLLTLMGVSILAFVISSVLFFWVQMRTLIQITVPISVLAKNADAVSKGEYKALSIGQMGKFSEIISLGQSFARMVAAVEERDHLMEQRVADRTKRLKILAMLEEHFAAILDPDVLLLEIVNQVRDNFDYYFVNIMLLDDARETLIIREATGDIGAQMKALKSSIPLDAAPSLIAKAARTGEVVNVNNVREDPDWLPYPLLPDCYAEVAVPIIIEDEVIGVLDVQKDEITAFDASETDMFRSLANQIGIALHNARLYTEMENLVTRRTAELLAANEALTNELQERRQAEALIRMQRDLALEFSVVTGLEETLRLFMDTALHIAGMDAGGIYLVGESGDVELAFHRGLSLAFSETTSYYDANSANARLVLQGESIYINYQKLDIPLSDVERQEGLRSIAILPIYYENQVIACLNIASRSLDDIPANARNALEAIAAQIGSALARVRVEAEITRLQRLLQNVTDSMPSVLIGLDTAGQVLLWNPAAEALTGLTAKKVKGRSLWDTCPDLGRYRDLFEQVLSVGQGVRRHREALILGSHSVYRDVDIFPLMGDRVEGGVLRIDDVTSHVHLEEMMLQSAKMASVGGLAAGVAHEINNPLGAMMQSAQMLHLTLDPRRDNTRQRLHARGIDPDQLEHYLMERGTMEYLDGIRTAGARAAKIVSDLLSFSRDASSNVAPHDLNLLVEQTLDLAETDYDLKKKYDFRNMQVVRELAADLPIIVCNGQQIQQVILNLVRNAAQAMIREKERQGGEYHPLLILRTMWNGDKVRLEVEDNGPGIPESVRQRLFEPFFTTKDVGEGTGLGLWLSWSIVRERHKGQIWVESGVKGGACFIIELPVRQI